MAMKLVLMVCVATLVGYVAGHGRLEEPPGRATAWRYGFNTPRNYQDNELFCGGLNNQQNQGGKCGVCGDPYQGPHPHEAGGKYATGTIVRRYDQDSKMAVRVHLTANHKGWMEFRLCPVNHRTTKATLECLDRNLLTVSGTQDTRFKVTYDMRLINVNLDLPQGLTCTQCVLQWKYHAGNRWDTDPITKKGCLGCGPQEEFYGCSDIAIDATRPGTPPPVHKTTTQHPTQPTRRITTPPPRKTSIPPAGKTTPTRPPVHKTTTQHPTQPTRWMTTPPPRKTSIPPAGKTTPTHPPVHKTTTQHPTQPTRWMTTPPPRKTSIPPAGKTTPTPNLPAGWCGYKCCALGVWRQQGPMNEWCMNNCSRGFCPPSHCKCLD